MKQKFKIGDIVLVKENTTGGHDSGTICIITDYGYNDPDYVSYVVEKLGGGRTMRHDQNDLRKIKKFDKEWLSNQDVPVKKGDVVIVKRNRSKGHQAGTICRVKKFESLGSLLIQDIATGETKWHSSNELRKIKGYDK